MSNVSWQRCDGGDVILEENWLFRLRRERYRSRASGREHNFYVLQLADAVNVVALTPDRRLVLVRQFRAGSGQDSLETPGGLLDPGENPLEAGARELLEETGYAGDRPKLLGTLWANPSLLNSKVTTIVITNSKRVAEPRLDHAEEVEVELVPDDQIPRMIRDGRLDHALAVGGLLWWLVSELPGPLAQDYPAQRKVFQHRIQTLMAIIATFAVLFALIAKLWYLDSQAFAVFIALGAFFLALTLPFLFMFGVFLWLRTPRRQSALVRSAEIARRLRLRLLLTMYGR